MAEKFHYTLKTDGDDKPTIDQQQIGKVSISYNPDDEKFYVQDQEHAVYATGKSWRNIVGRANELLQKQKRRRSPRSEPSKKGSGSPTTSMRRPRPRKAPPATPA